MAAITLCETPLANLKKSLRDEFPDVKSSHLSEALAYSLGFRTHAALQSAVAATREENFFIVLDDERFVARLSQLGYAEDPEFDFEMVVFKSIPGLISTMPESAYSIEYNTDREKAWRNLMVCTINAALEQKLFSLHPGDNRFQVQRGHPELFDFQLPNGLPARGSVSDAGFHELSIHAAVNPKGPLVRTVGANFDAGDAYGTTWLERERGAWMQTVLDSFHCRRPLLKSLATLDVTPHGYGDRGRIIM